MSQLEHHSFLSKEIGSCQKKRARKACSGCRARKVRCDVLIVGHPCTQCRDNEFECTVKERKKRQMKVMVSFNEKRNFADSAPSMPEHTMLHQVPFYSFFKNFARQGRGTQQVATGNLQQSQVALPISLGEPCTNSTGDNLEIEFLKHKGVFTLPPKDILDECIAAYFRIFHPFFPIVDKIDFLNAYERLEHDYLTLERHGPSLLLLQAVLFTAASFLPMEKIREMGFNTRQHARSTYHQRARYLYEFNYEPNIITNIQALLLMSHYYTSMVEQKHTWFWAHQAISLAQGAGLHHQSHRQPKQKLWTKIWWGCVVRDRLIALGTGRPMHIISLDCTVPILTAADLAEAGDSEEDCAVKQVFIEFTKLCQHMEGVLLLSSTDERLVQSQHQVCEAALQGWLHDLPQVARRDSTTAQTGTGETPVLYRNILYLILNIVLLALYRTGQPDAPTTAIPSSQMQRAAKESSQIISELIESNLVGICPTICVTAVIPPLIVHTLVMRGSADKCLISQTSLHFQTCMEFLKRLGEIYWHASFYHEFFELVAPTIEKQIPRLPVRRQRSRHPVTDENTPSSPSNIGEPTISNETHFDASNFMVDEQVFEDWLANCTNFHVFFPSA